VKTLTLTFASLLTMSLMMTSANAEDDAPAPADAPPPAADVPPPPPPGGRPSFASFDADADGKITLAEFEAAFQPREMNGRTPQAADVFGRWDADSDGAITEDEMANRPMRPPGGQPPPRD
jgi:hypothetical protein